MSQISELVSSGKSYRIIDLPAAAGAPLAKMPWILRILLENVLRKSGDEAAAETMAALAGWLGNGTSEAEIEFYPTRVLMHDTTCGPALADIAAMRSVLAEEGCDPAILNPVLPVDVSTDHSLPVDFFAAPDAMKNNMDAEMRRNAERYRFAKWASTTLRGLRVHPPGTGIMHTLNLERLATVVAAKEIDGQRWAYPDTLIGTDSHTPMINGIGVLAWGVGGLEAESVIFDMPVMLRIPDVVGVRLSGRLPAGAMATDLALLVTQRLRETDLCRELAGRVEYRFDRCAGFPGEGLGQIVKGVLHVGRHGDRQGRGRGRTRRQGQQAEQAGKQGFTQHTQPPRLGSGRDGQDDMGCLEGGRHRHAGGQPQPAGALAGDDGDQPGAAGQLQDDFVVDGAAADVGNLSAELVAGR